MVRSVSGKDRSNFCGSRPTPKPRKDPGNKVEMDRMLRCDWLPVWDFVRPGLRPVSRQKNCLLSQVINLYCPSLFGQDGWLLARFLFFFCVFMDRDGPRAWAVTLMLWKEQNQVHSFSDRTTNEESQLHERRFEHHLLIDRLIDGSY